jgi:hypothetical protein
VTGRGAFQAPPTPPPPSLARRYPNFDHHRRGRFRSAAAIRRRPERKAPTHAHGVVGPCHERGPSALFARPQPCAHGVGALRATRREYAHLRVRPPGGRQGAGRVEGESMTTRVQLVCNSCAIRVQLESHSKATRWQRGATPTRTSTGIVRSRFAASVRARRSRRERSRVRPLRPLSLEPLGRDEQQSQGRSVRHAATMSTPGTARTRAHSAPLYKGAVRHVCAHKRDVGRAGFRTQAQWPRAITKN